MVWLCKYIGKEILNKNQNQNQIENQIENENEINNLFAIKQISKKNKNEQQSFNMNYKIGKRELELLDFIYKRSSKDDCENIIKLVDSIEDNNDIWLIFEKGGKSLSSLMFKIKGEFLGNERIYLIQKGKYLGRLFENISNFKNFLKKMLNFIKNISSNGLVHCDLKPENILIDYSYDENDKKIIYNSFKIIDFGSSFYIDQPDNFSSNTPEYMSPEITDLIEKNASSKEIGNFLNNLINWPSTIDIWSLAVMILEMLLCCPLWMNYKAKVNLRGKVLNLLLFVI
jgi:serine/threonine protein kinase